MKAPQPPSRADKLKALLDKKVQERNAQQAAPTTPTPPSPADALANPHTPQQPAIKSLGTILDSSPGSSIAFSKVYAAYTAACAARGDQPLSQDDFIKEVERSTGATPQRIAGRLRYFNYELNPDWMSNAPSTSQTQPPAMPQVSSTPPTPTTPPQQPPAPTNLPTGNFSPAATPPSLSAGSAARMAHSTAPATPRPTGRSSNILTSGITGAPSPQQQNLNTSPDTIPEPAPILDDTILETLSKEGEKMIQDILREIGSHSFVDEVKNLIDGGQDIAQLEADYITAMEKGEVAAIAATNPFARIAISKSMERFQKVVENRFTDIKTFKAPKPIGQFADLRNAPVSSLAEPMRFVPEVGIAFIAGNSAKNMVLDVLSKSESTAHLSYDNRIVLASAIGIAMSWMAYRLRHSLYDDAQKDGHKYPNLPMKRWSSAGTAYTRVFAKAPITTTLRTAMALGVAVAGGNILLNLAGTSEQSVSFGGETLKVTKPLGESIGRAAGIMDGFFVKINERCHAIVAAEVDPSKAGKGTGKGAAPSYGPKAAAKDYLCFGKTEGRDKDVPDSLKKFRTSIGIAERVSIAKFYEQLWREDEAERQSALASVLERLGAFQGLVEAESSTSFGTHAERAVLKNIPDSTVIPKAKQSLVEAIRAYVDIINKYSEKVDAISKRIATEGLAAANAAGQDIEIQAPRVSIDTAPLSGLPNSPIGKSGFFLTRETAKGALDALNKVPGVNFVSSLLDKESPLLPMQLMLLAALVYLLGENAPNTIFVNRERLRSRKLKRELDPKRKDYYMLLDQLALRIASLTQEVIVPYNNLFGTSAQNPQSFEQLVSAVKFAFVNQGADMDVATSSPEERSPFAGWWDEKSDNLVHTIKHLYDWGPEDRVELDEAIRDLQKTLDAFSKGTPQQNAALLKSLGIPGSEILVALFDPSIGKDPIAFAKQIESSEIQALQYNVRHLVLKIQAREFVLDQIGKDVLSNEGANHTDAVRESLSRGVILNLDGKTSPIAVSADELKYYRVWAELAAEQEQDRADLFRVVAAGKTMWDRSFGLDYSLGTVDIPDEFKNEFIGAALSKPVGNERMLIESYKQMLDRMLTHKDDSTEFTEILSYLNQNVIPGLQQDLEDEPRLRDRYSFSFGCAFSSTHGGPVVRCTITQADTGAYVSAVEAPHIVTGNGLSQRDFSDQVAQWFAEGGPGRLEAIARSRSHELQGFVTTFTHAINANGRNIEPLLRLNGTEELLSSTITNAQKDILYRSLLGRQRLRIESIRHSPLTEGEMRLFELPDQILDPNLLPAEIVQYGGISVDGLFQLEAVLAELRARTQKTFVDLDVIHGRIVVTDRTPQQKLGPVDYLRRRRASGTSNVRTFPLRALNDIRAFVATIEGGRAES